MTIVKVNEPLAVFSGPGPLGDLPPLPLPALPGRGDLPPLPGRGDLPGCGAAPLGDFLEPRALFTIARGEELCAASRFSRVEQSLATWVSHFFAGLRMMDALAIVNALFEGPKRPTRETPFTGTHRLWLPIVD